MAWGFDPGPCPVCDVAHTACTSADYTITIAQLPMRDASAASAPAAVEPASPSSVPAASATSFTTKTYRRRRVGR